jgi:hypothetical protein
MDQAMQKRAVVMALLGSFWHPVSGLSALTGAGDDADQVLQDTRWRCP